VRWLLAEIKLDLLRLQYWRKAYNPNQPRVPAGNADGGQWSTEGGGATSVDQGLVPEGEHDQPTESWDSTPELNDGLQPTIEFVAARDRAAGHHYVPQGVFKKYDFPEDTRRVFDSARTGPIPDRATNYFDQQHRTYNDAVEDVLKRHMDQNKISAEHMTPAQARDVIREVIRSRDPRIQGVNRRIWNSIRGRGID
jgi:hypothetical protein